jgi:hypothetical protein
MIQRCPHCPTTDNLVKSLSDLFIDIDDDQEITFCQWQTTDRSTLIHQSAPVEEFVETLVEKLQNLTAHSFIAKAQSLYLRNQKDVLDECSAIILGDFAENYQFVVQDEIQSFHWNSSQCSLHPVVLYFKEANKLQCQSFCFLSDDLQHDVYFVYHIQKILTNYLKSHYQYIQHLKYFSDGCAAQYKN